MNFLLLWARRSRHTCRAAGPWCEWWRMCITRPGFFVWSASSVNPCSWLHLLWVSLRRKPSSVGLCDSSPLFGGIQLQLAHSPLCWQPSQCLHGLYQPVLSGWVPAAHRCCLHEWNGWSSCGHGSSVRRGSHPFTWGLCDMWSSDCLGQAVAVGLPHHRCRWLCPVCDVIVCVDSLWHTCSRYSSACLFLS